MILLFLIIVTLIILGVYVSKSDKETLFKSKKEHLSFDEKERRRVGKNGEMYVNYHLKAIIKKHGGYLFEDFCFKDNKGYSCEIDHILITRGGVFVIETKTNKGIIRGERDSEEWKCMKEIYQDDKILKNPIIQNEKHINHLKRMFTKIPPKMMSIVIFPIANISHVKYGNVFNMEDAIEYIVDSINKNKYSNEFVERINSQLNDIKARYGITKEEHIENIKSKHY